jgi:hypothetical protein
LNNVNYESTNLLEDKMIFSVTINSIKYTAYTDYDLNVLNVLAPISIDEWINQGCTSNATLAEVPEFIESVTQQLIKNWWYRNKNYFDNFYSSQAIKKPNLFMKNSN